MIVNILKSNIKVMIKATKTVQTAVFLPKLFNSSGSSGSVGYKLSLERYFRPSIEYWIKPKNIPIAANEKPRWKLTCCPNQPTVSGAMKAPMLIPKTKILKPESRLVSSGAYKPPTISETFGLSSPVPITIKAIDKKRAILPNGVAKTICPNMIKTPPTKTVFRLPQIRSLTKPPITLDK